MIFWRMEQSDDTSIYWLQSKRIFWLHHFWRNFSKGNSSFFTGELLTNATHSISVNVKNCPDRYGDTWVHQVSQDICYHHYLFRFFRVKTSCAISKIMGFSSHFLQNLFFAFLLSLPILGRFALGSNSVDESPRRARLCKY